MPQAVQVETQSEQQGLARLHPERAAGGASRELALHRREHRFDQGAAPVELWRERPPHFGAHSAHPPGFLPTLGGDHALGPELPADIRSVIPLALVTGLMVTAKGPCPVATVPVTVCACAVKAASSVHARSTNKRGDA